MYDLIVATPGVLGGKPRIKDTRLSVQLILEFVAGGASVNEIAAEYPDVPRDGIVQALRYAASQFETNAQVRAQV